MFFSRKEKPHMDYKARLERKLYLARETPEPVFDLSDCALKAVPAGIYSLCRVFRKEALYLQDNHLTSLSGGGRLEDLLLLCVLDLHSNSLSKLPNEISYLQNLRELNVSENMLTSLPQQIGELRKLSKLDVANNDIKELPCSLGNLTELGHLDIRWNKKLVRLPQSLYLCTSLELILLDAGNFVYPASSVTRMGTEAIMKFLCAENKVKYISPKDAENNKLQRLQTNNNTAHKMEEDTEFEDKIQMLETLKEQKQRERLALEREILEQQRRELELQTASKQSKEKLLEDLMQQQSHLESQILRVQQSKQSERQHLVEELQRVEVAADTVVSQLLAASSLRDSSYIQSLVEQEQQEERRLLSSCQDDYKSLRRQDVLSAMQSLLEEEAQYEARVREFEKGRAECTRSLLSQEAASGAALAELLRSRGQEQEQLASRLQRDEELQRAAVAALLERGDARAWGLTQELRLVQEQLATLTALEMRRRQLQLSGQLDDLSEKRVALSELLVGLLEQQAERRRQLLETLHEMERLRSEEQQERDYGFWLVQYQRLLDARGQQLAEMERSLDPALVRHLLNAGALHYLPLVGHWLLEPGSLHQLTDDQLTQVGVLSAEARTAILKAVAAFCQEQEQRSAAPVAASAPTEVDSQPPFAGGVAECVVCMDSQCEVIFIPCGHLCCCSKCSSPLQQCPMCRQDIQQKIRAILP